MNCLSPFYSLPLTVHILCCPYTKGLFIYVLLATIIDISNNPNSHSIHPQYNEEVIILHFVNKADHKEWFAIKNG